SNAVRFVKTSCYCPATDISAIPGISSAKPAALAAPKSSHAVWRAPKRHHSSGRHLAKRSSIMVDSMSAAEVFIPADRLIAFAEDLLNATRVSEHKSRLVAMSLVAANLRGVYSHGVQLLRYYLEQLNW